MRFSALVKRLVAGLLGKRYIRFMLVGASGALVGLAVTRLVYTVYAFLRHGALLWVPVTIGFEASVINNFLWHERWTFRSGMRGWWPARLIAYNVTSIGSYMAQGTAVQVLTGVYGADITLAQLTGVLAGYIINYLLSAHGTWRKYHLGRDDKHKNTGANTRGVQGETG